MKCEGWERMLSEFVAAELSSESPWGCIMAARWVETCTAYRAPSYLMSPKTTRGALSALKKFSGGSVIAAADRIASEIGAEE